MISEVKIDQLDTVWPSLLPMVTRGLSHGQGDSMHPCHILDDLKAGNMVLWVSYKGETLEAGMVFEVNEFPAKKVVFVVMLAGERMDDWVEDMEKAILQYCENVGADCIEASCRPGLAKRLEKRGWKRKAVILEAPNGR